MERSESMVRPPVGRGIDVGAIKRGVAGRQKKSAKYARKGKAIPAELIPDVEGMELEDQVVTLHGAFVLWSQQREPSADDRQDHDRISRVLRMYEQLRRLGCNLEDARGFREKHGPMLLAQWRREGRAISTIRSDWSILRTWALALGKFGMLGELEQYWADAPRIDRGAKRTKAQLRADTHGDPAVLTELLRGADRTHWYVERLCNDLDLTVEEALRFAPGIAGDHLAGKIIVRTGAGGADRRTVQLDTEQKLLLVQEVVEFIVGKGRKVLAWQDMKPAQALRKHQQRMTYLRRKVRAETSRAPAGTAADRASAMQQATQVSASADGDEDRDQDAVEFERAGAVAAQAAGDAAAGEAA